jgi:hypothetical protein
MENCQKIILDLCGGTGAWSRPYAEAGYDVRNITLPDYDVQHMMMTFILAVVTIGITILLMMLIIFGYYLLKDYVKMSKRDK